jgi:drug/metabolite transporter (DMT)-like permease
VRHPHRRGMLMVAGAALAWSFSGLFFRLAAVDVPTILCGRAIAAALFLAGVLAWNKGPGFWRSFFKLGWAGFVVAALFVIDGACYMSALHYTSVAHVVVMLSLTPLFAAVAGLVALGEKVRLAVWVAIVAAFAGVAMMVGGNIGGGAWLGDALALGVPTFFALITVITRRHREAEVVPTVCLSAILTALVFLPFASFGKAGPQDLVVMAGLGVDEFGIGLLLYLAGAKLIPAAEAALISLLETVTAPLWVWIALGENPGVRAIIGGAIVLAALAGTALADLRARTRNPMPPSAGRL